MSEIYGNTPEYRYMRDPLFRAMVDTFYHAIVKCEVTPTEVREAAMLACIRYEANRPARMLYDMDMEFRGPEGDGKGGTT